MKSDVIDIALELRQDREKSFAVWNGARDGNDKEIWIFLPKSHVENNGDGTFTMPEWLAKEKGLI